MPSLAETPRFPVINCLCRPIPEQPLTPAETEFVAALTSSNTHLHQCLERERVCEITKALVDFRFCPCQQAENSSPPAIVAVCQNILCRKNYHRLPPDNSSDKDIIPPDPSQIPGSDYLEKYSPEVVWLSPTKFRIGSRIFELYEKDGIRGWRLVFDPDDADYARVPPLCNSPESSGSEICPFPDSS